jgi:hypothetical protein
MSICAGQPRMVPSVTAETPRVGWKWGRAPLTLAIQDGCQGDHGWAIFVKQGSKRALLLDTVDGLTPEEVLWTALACWANFKPRSESVRRFPGRLYYPDQFTHVFQKYWKHLFNLSSHPDFVDKSPICKERMTIFSEAMRKFKRTKNWAPQPCAEAPEKGLRIAQEAAQSRVRPIADGPNQWEVCRSSTVTVAASQSGMVGTGSSPTLGSLDTRAARSSPSLTQGALFPAGFPGDVSVWLGNRHQGSHDMNVGRVQRDRRVVTRMSRLLAERYLT